MCDVEGKIVTGWRWCELGVGGASTRRTSAGGKHYHHDPHSPSISILKFFHPDPYLLSKIMAPFPHQLENKYLMHEVHPIIFRTT